jgi:hypothetical protein
MALSKVGKNQVDQSASLTVDSDLTVDTNTLYVDSTNNRVGVGTSSPATALDVTGAITTDGLTSEAANGTITSKASGASFCSFTANTSAGNNAYVFFQQAGTEMSRITAFNGDALAFSTGSGATERLRIDSSGRVTMPYQPAFSAYFAGNNNGTSTLAGGGGQIVFNNTYHNQGGHYSTSTGRFTAPVSGVYQFNTCLFGYNQGQISASASSAITIQKNGVQYHYIAYNYLDSSSSYPELSGSVILYCNANDYVTLHTSTGVYTDSSDAYTHWSGYLVG